MDNNAFIWLLLVMAVWLIAGVLILGDVSYVWHR